mgnify:CR=1 FL=1
MESDWMELQQSVIMSDFYKREKWCFIGCRRDDLN